MKLGVFDSGLGGLWMLRHLRAFLPAYDYVFFGDTINVPYGAKTKEELLVLTKKALKFFYEEHNCVAVLLACNTTSSTIFEELKAWVMDNYPGHFVFGIVKPTVEAVPENKSVNVFATQRTIDSQVYSRLLTSKESFPEVLGSPVRSADAAGRPDHQENLSLEDRVFSIALPELATLIENGGDTLGYLQTFTDIPPSDIGLLVCTHYGIVREHFIKAFPQIKSWLSQEEIIPQYFATYLDQKIDFKNKLSVGGTVKIFASSDNNVFNNFAQDWFPGSVVINRGNN